MLFSSSFWLFCLGFSFIIYWVSELQRGAAGSGAGRVGLGADAQERREKGEVELCTAP